MEGKLPHVSFWSRITTQLIFMNLILMIVFGAYFGINITNFQSTVAEANNISDVCLSAMVLRGDMKKDYEKIQRYIYAYIAIEDAEEREHLIENIDKRYTQLMEGIGQIQEYLHGNSEVSISDMEEGLTTYVQHAREVLLASEGKSMEEVVAQIDALEGEDEKFDSNLELANTYFEEMVVQSRQRQQSKYEETISISVIGSVIILVIIGINLLLFYRNIVRPINGVSMELRQIIEAISRNRGDLSVRIANKTKSELSILISGMNDFLKTLQSIIGGVSQGTKTLASSNDKIIHMVINANDNITDSSAAMEELAANMEMVNNVSGGIRETIEGVKAQVDILWREASEGSRKAVEVSENARAMKEHIVGMKELTAQKIGEITEVLNESIQESEKVSRISVLSETILSIASETELLSLNASIEAARAGEAGRGFNVVAGEINSLADNSQKTARDIQCINQEVIQAVRELSDHTSEMLDYIHNSILGDYDRFVDAMDEYVNNMEGFHEILQNFSSSSDSLNGSMGEITQSVEYITNAVSESSSAMNISAESVTGLVEKMKEVQNAVDTCRGVSGRLETEIRHFVTAENGRV